MTLLAPRCYLLPLLTVAAALVAACTAPISSFQAGHVPQKGRFHAHAGSDVIVPTGTIDRSIEAGKALAEAASSRVLDAADRRKVIEAGTNLALSPPAFLGHAALAFAPLDRFEVGLRIATGGAIRFGGRYQFLDQDLHGWDLSAGLGIQRFTYEFPVDKFLDVLKLDDFTRWSVDVPVTVGRHGDFYRLWGGPRLIAFKQDTKFTLNLPKVGDVPAEQASASAGGTGALVGLHAGVAVGYKVVFLAFELTMLRLVSTAELNLAGQRTDVDLGGWVISPGLAVVGGF